MAEHRSQAGGVEHSGGDGGGPSAEVVELSIIAPAHNERQNIAGLLQDVETAMAPGGPAFELIVIDDGSTDGTGQELQRAMAARPWLRVVTHTHCPPGRGLGLSAGMWTGIRAARGELVSFIDADRQNDPAGIPAMVQRLRAEGADLVQGDRSANRRDGLVKRCTSWVGRTFRRVVLGDTIRDTGCSQRVIRRGVALRLPLHLRGMHRFIPFYVRMMGGKVVEMPVVHRPRVAGEAKFGVWNRALPGLRDLLAVRYMRSRWTRIESREQERQGQER